MQTLIRFIHKDRKGREELYEEALEDSVISVGHGSDQDIQLRDPAIARRHLELKPLSGGRFRFKAIGGTRVIVNGSTRSRGVLKQEDQLELGEQSITVSEPKSGFDAVLEVVSVEQKHAVGPVTNHRIDLDQTGLGMRGPAWLLFFAILILFLGLPLAGYFSPDLQDNLRDNPALPSDHVWSPGPLANVHHTPDIGKNCNACHLELFERTPDRGCLDCHAGVTDHVDQQSVSVPKLDETRCASCHREHKKPATLVRNDSRLCVDCHRDPERYAEKHSENGLPSPVKGFSDATHPEFRLALLQQGSNNGEWSIERKIHPGEAAIEQSNLRFPHDLHMNPDRVTSLVTGQALECSSCHVLKDDGEHFKPITMEDSCQDCHSLTFDEQFPRKKLPHGDVEAALVALKEHYIRRNADPDLRGDGIERGRRRPGRVATVDQCEGTALECGREQALQEAISQFSHSGCVTCHEVSEDPDRPMIERWQVLEVRITDNWYPFSRFNHVVHLTRSRGQFQDESECLACHTAHQSSKAEDVLIPGIDNCLQCHSDKPESGISVKLNCNSCHDFHLPFKDAMRSVEMDSDHPPGKTDTLSYRGSNHD